MHAQLEACEYLEGMQQLLAELSEQGVQMHAMSNYPVWYQDINAKLQIDRCASQESRQRHNVTKHPLPCHGITARGRTLYLRFSV